MAFTGKEKRILLAAAIGMFSVSPVSAGPVFAQVPWPGDQVTEVGNYAVCRTANQAPVQLSNKKKRTTFTNIIQGTFTAANDDCSFPIDIISAQRDVYAVSSYNGSFLDVSNPPPQPVDINEIDEQSLSYSVTGVWDQALTTGVLEDVFGPGNPGNDPITASANQVSVISTSGGSVSIGLFSDQYWGSNNPYLLSQPFGDAGARSSYTIAFTPNTDVVLAFNGFLSTNFATMGSTNIPKGSAGLTVTEVSTDTDILQIGVTTNSTVSFNDLVESLDGTNVQLTGGETYEMLIRGIANSAANTSPNNAEAELEVTWEIQ